MKNKKAQAALEFLTTYGWAFLVILIMIGALSYFGVLDPSRFLPDKCLFGAGLGVCQEFTIDSAGQDIMFKLINNFGAQINVWPIGDNGTVVQINGLSTACTAQLNASPVGTPMPGLPISGWNTSQTMVFNISNCVIGVGERPTVKITLGYTPNGQTYPKVVEGEISAKRSS